MLRLENRHSGEVLVLTHERAGGIDILHLAGTLPPHRDGPPLHIHHLEDEDGVVLTGRLSVQLGDRSFEAGPGEPLTLPRGQAHRWWNAGDQPLSVNGRAFPLVDLDRYLQAVFEIINAGPPGRPSLFYLAHLARRHRHTQAMLVMPLALQAVLFPLVVAVGTVLGKYRGTDWPGCPDRCVGVPRVD